MAKLIIEDLPEDAELDAEALKAISGGKPIGRGQALALERRFRAGAQLEESPLVRGLIRNRGLRELGRDG